MKRKNKKNTLEKKTRKIMKRNNIKKEHIRKYKKE